MYYHLFLDKYILHYGFSMKYNFHFSLAAMHTFSKKLWFVQENHDNVKPDLNVASCKAKVKAKGKSTNLKENVKSVVVIRAVLWAESVDVALNIAGVEIIHLENLWLWSSLKSIWFELSFSDSGNFFLLWLVILKSVWHTVRDTL